MILCALFESFCVRFRSTLKGLSCTLGVVLSRFACLIDPLRRRRVLPPIAYRELPITFPKNLMAICSVRL